MARVGTTRRFALDQLGNTGATRPQAFTPRAPDNVYLLIHLTQPANAPLSRGPLDDVNSSTYQADEQPARVAAGPVCITRDPGQVPQSANKATIAKKARRARRIQKTFQNSERSGFDEWGVRYNGYGAPDACHGTRV